MARHGTHGIELQMSNGAATPVFTEIAQVGTITPPQGSRGFTPVAEHDMTGAIEKLADALRDEGQVTMTCDFDPNHATHDETTGFESVFRAGAARAFRLIFPDTGTKQADFSALVVARNYEAYPANAGIGQASITLEITGAITWT